MEVEFLAPAETRWAGGGTSSKRRSLKWPSFIATPNTPLVRNHHQPHETINTLEHKYVPPVLSQMSLQTFISAASATTDTRIFSFTQASTVSWILSGSHVVSAPNMITISRDEWTGKCLSRYA